MIKKISIIVPVYNVEKYIEQCLLSIQNQSFRDFEVLIVNDGSTDNSASICKRFCETDNRFMLYSQPNGGLSAARNTGIRRAQGELLLFVDSDDYIHPQMCEILYQNMDFCQADISICGFRRIKEETKNYFDLSAEQKLDVCSGKEGCRNIYAGRSVESVVAWNKLYKRELFRDILYPEGKIHEDEFVTYKLLYFAKRVVYTNLELYYYMQRSDSIMQKRYGKEHMVMLEMAEESISFYLEHSEKELARLAMNRALGLCTMLYDKYGQVHEEKQQKKVLKKYRIFLSKYLNYMELGSNETVVRRLYGYSPKWAARYQKMAGFCSRAYGKLKRIMQK